MIKKPFNPITRIFFILLLMAASPGLSIFILIAIIQSLSIYFNHTPIQSLSTISRNLLIFYTQIVAYTTGLKHTPPFPFSPWDHHNGT